MALAHKEQAACLGRLFWFMMAGARPRNKQKLEQGVSGSTAPCQSPLASSCAAPSIQPCSLQMWGTAWDAHRMLSLAEPTGLGAGWGFCTHAQGPSR